jgi:replicative DNA helicase
MDSTLEGKFLAHVLKSPSGLAIAQQKGITSDFFQEDVSKKLFDINRWYVNTYGVLLSASELEGSLKQATTLDDEFKKSILKSFFELQLLPLDTDINFLCDQFSTYYKKNLLETALRRAGAKYSNNEIEDSIAALKYDLVKIDSKFRVEESRSGQLDEFGDRIFAEYEDRKVNPSKYEGLKLGFGELDKIIGGLVKSSVSILLAPPKDFKTALAMTICYNVAKRGVYSVYFANEGTIELFYMRFAAMELSIPLSNIKDGNMTGMEESRWIQFITSVREGKHQILNKIYFAEVPLSLSTPTYLAELLKKLREEGKNVGLVVIDHFGRMTTTDKTISQDWQKKGVVAEELCNLARSERVPFFLLTHVKSQSAKDALEDNADFSAYDIERSGQPLKDVDYVFSWRIENREEFDRNGKKGFARLALVLSRHSETCGSVLQINGKYMQIQEMKIGGTNQVNNNE